MDGGMLAAERKRRTEKPRFLRRFSGRYARGGRAPTGYWPATFAT
jgi:hypothetical protein